MNLQQKIQSDVLEIRAQVESFLIDIIDHYPLIGETIQDGEGIFEYSGPYTRSCRLINRSGDERTNVAAQERSPRFTAFTSHERIQLPFGTLVHLDDKFVYTDKSSLELRTFKVVYVPPIHAMMGAFVIHVEEMR